MSTLYRFIIAGAFLFISAGAVAQPYGNEWINFSTNQQYSNQQYFKVSVWKDGVYRITYSDLQAAAFPIPFNPKQLQLFHLGKEQYIHVEGEADGSFDPTDYIEFLGRHNDASLDYRMYRDSSHILNSDFSLITDTAAYFLTLNSNQFVQNRRIIQETDVNYLGYTPLPWFLRDAKATYQDGNQYQAGYNCYSYAQVVDPGYDEGEGYTSIMYPSGFSKTVSVPNVSTDSSAPLARATTVVMGANTDGGNLHQIAVDVNGSGASAVFSGFAVNRFDFPLSSNSQIQSGTATFTFTPGSSGNNLNTVPFVRVLYPHTFNFNGEGSSYYILGIPGTVSGAPKSYLEFSNLNMGATRLYMFSGDTLKQVAMTGTGNSRQALVPTYFTDKKCILTDTLYTRAAGQLYITPVSTDPSRFGRFVNYNYINQGNYLIVSHSSLMQKAQSYMAHRNSTGFTTLLADVDELYDQFAYGIEKHPMSIRNFCEFALDTFSVKPEYLLLLGKSVVANDTRIIPGMAPVTIAATGQNWDKNLVPTYGYPPSDMLFTSAMNDSIFRPKIAVGRIAAQTPDDVQAYLDKITVHDFQQTQPPQPWMKQILHFGGGNSPGQIQQIAGILGGFENVIEDSLFGGNVTTFLKTSSAPIQINQSAYLQALIDSGTTIMTFVAHASGLTFDISTDIPQNYNNKDRYPLVIANSCFIGDIHTPDRLISEDFVLLPDRGSIGFIAEPSLGYLENLEPYTRALYQQIGKHNYGGTLGKSMQNTIDSVITNPNFTSNQYVRFMYKSVCMGMTLHGDPAMGMNSFPKAEYVVSNPDVFFTPSVVTAEADSFEVNVVVSNIGRVVSTPSTIHVVRKFPDGGADLQLDSVIGAVTYRDTISFRLAVNSARGTGLNLFDVYVDYFNTIDEYTDTNNSVVNKPLLIQSSEILPVYPAEFAIVPGNDITLKASTANPLAPTLPYVFQIDTVDTFNSPAMQQLIKSSSGGVVEWDLPFTIQENLVYYWRVSRDSMATDTIHPKWNESSFIHKQGKTGWSQAHYSQFKKDTYNNVVYSNGVPDTTFQFVTSYSSLLVRNYYYPDQVTNPYYEINSIVQDYQFCTYQPSIHIAVIDSLSLIPWETGPNHNYGNDNPYPFQPGFCNRGRSEKYFIFRPLNPTSMNSMLSMLQNDVPSGNYVIAYSVFGGQFTQMPAAVRQLFTTWGSDSINFLSDDQSWIFFTKKGDPSYTQEVIGDSLRTVITLDTLLGGNWYKGLATSVPIGPATQWTSLHWEQSPLETGATADSVALDIIGITPGGQEVVLVTGIQPTTADTNISWIDHMQYPRLKLRAYLQDGTLFSPPQLKRWQIYYDEVMELALNPLKYFKINKDTLQEGETLTVEMAIENISNVSADSVLTRFYLYDAGNAFHSLSQPRYKILPPGDTLIASVVFNTSGYTGLNSLWIEANPSFDQPEQYHFNNLAEIPFRVNEDITNPILDVTFDGIHILDGDIVSGKPLISIKLKDENKFIALKDTTHWQVFLKDPSGNQVKLRFEQAPCSGGGTELMIWCPATLPDNTFRIEYKPQLLSDGVYELFVQATDESGNVSGDNRYQITFEVINRSTITEVVNYPNPFSTSTRFVFTLTGSEVPDYFKIQIMTVSGKIVREITKDELGPIRIGRNITEYAWNGKDEFGDQLANGVYLYRVITVLNGSSIEKRETEADKYFTKGWGKMYLLR